MSDSRSLRDGLKCSGPNVTAPALSGDCPAWTVDQTSHRLICDALRGVLRQAVQAGPGADEGIGSIRYRALAVLYTLLLDHPIDRQGRCRSCRRPGAMIGLRRRPCRIHIRASYWLLRQPDEALLLSHLADELDQGTAPAPGAASPPDRSSLTAGIDPRDTDVLPRVMGDPRTDPSQTPAVPSPLPPRGFRRAGRPDQDHGGAGDERHQQLLPVASAGQGVEHLTGGALTAGFARTAWPEAAPVPDLTLPLATIEPEHCGDRAAEATADGAPDAD